jgi:hypothetical protein
MMADIVSVLDNKFPDNRRRSGYIREKGIPKR